MKKVIVITGASSGFGELTAHELAKAGMVGPANRMRIQILDQRGRPAPSAEVLVRDSNAEYEEWYKTNGEGETDVEPRGTTITFAVVYKGTLTEETTSAASIEKLRSENKKIVIHLK